MQWWGPAYKVERIDEPEAIVFRISTQRRKAALLIPVACGLAMIVTLVGGGGLGKAALFGVVAIGSLWFWYSTSTATVRVSATGMEATDDGFRKGKNAFRANWTDVRDLRWESGRGEDDSPALYVTTTSGDQWCPALVEQSQAAEIIAAIRARFPGALDPAR